MNTTIIFTVLRWEKELAMQQKASAKRRYNFGVEEPTVLPREEKRGWLFDWHRPEPVYECRPRPACECT